MSKLFQIDEIIDSPSKVGILRVLVSRKGFKATGREIARLSNFSVPATHETLKDLYAHNILIRDIIGKQHIYALNEEDRIVKKLIRPMFEVELGLKEEIAAFIKEQMIHQGILKKVKSILLYGSLQKGEAISSSDVDVAIIVAKEQDVMPVSDAVIDISSKFKSYFGVQLDPYVKSAFEFKDRLKRNLPPIKSLMKAYAVLYGKQPLEI